MINRREKGILYREELQIAPAPDSKREVVNYIPIKRDVTKLRAVEEAQAFLAAIVENSEDAIVTFTASGVILTWNRGAELISGYSAIEAIGKHVSMLVPPDRLAELAIFTEQILLGNAASQPDGMCQGKDARRIHVSISGSPIRDESAKVVAVLAILRDSSERQEAEQTRALLASIVESSDDAIHSVKLDGTIVSWNRGAEVLFGYSRQEIIGSNAAILTQSGDGDALRQCIETIRNARTVSPFETVFKGRDGRAIDVWLAISPIRNPAGEVTGASVTARDIGKRLLTERNLRESEERFREVFEHAPFGMCVTALSGHFIQVNGAFCRMLGYSEEELLAKSREELTHPADLTRSPQLVELLRNDPDGSLEAENRCFHRNGSVVWVRIKTSMVRDSCNNPSYFVTHIENITARKRADDALNESEHRFRIMADGCPAMMWVTDAEGGNLFINRAFREFAGTTLDEVQGTKWQLVLHPEDAPGYVEAFQRSLREHSSFRAEARIRRADGEWRWVESYAEPRLSPSGEFQGHVGLSPDITERKKSDETLRAIQDRYRMLAQAVQGSGECIGITDTEDRLLYVNDAFLRTYGYSEHELIGQHVDILRSARTSSETQRAILSAAMEGNWCGELWNRSKDGREFPISLATSVVYDENKRTIALVGIGRDITERKDAEYALQRSEERFRELAENIREVFWMISPATREILYVSPAYEQVWGRTCASVYQNPMSWSEAIHPDDQQRAISLSARQMQGEALDSEYRILTLDGHEKWILDRAFPIRDQSGQLIRVVGIAEDITERKRYEEELIQARLEADARSRVLEKINRREPLVNVLAAVSALLRQQFPGSDSSIRLVGSNDHVEMVAESCASPTVGGNLLAIVPADSKNAHSLPVLDANGQILGYISVCPRDTVLPESFAVELENTAQLVALSINSRRVYDGLTHRSQHDSLTGLPNRVFLDEHLASIIETAGGASGKFAIAYIDLDEFKKVNDIYGHTTGDTFLEVVAARFRSMLREEDVLARIGGDEFIAVLAGVDDRKKAVRLGLRLLESLNQPLAISDSLELPCTASIGIAMFPDDGSSIDELKHCADESMYVAKIAGRNRVEARDTGNTPKNQLSAVQLRKAIDENRPCVFYQPIFLAQGRLCGFEALARIVDASGQLIGPSRFIEVAEKSSLVVPLGRAVLRQACRQAALWERKTGAGLKMAVNVSARQFADPAFFNEVLTVLAEFQFPEGLLELEITEAAILRDLTGGIEQIQKLRRRGVRISMDDFGTGYSTLSLVHRLPLDAIKIDRSFVEELSSDGPSIHTIRAIVSLASGLRIQTIAEGVEQASQLQTLLALGCDAFQGFGFARPMPASSIETRLDGWLATVPNITDRLEIPVDRLADSVSNQPHLPILPSGPAFAPAGRP